jgi:OPA family sugar phosphate sensor protein UhpC-like MFS transporter
MPAVLAPEYRHWRIRVFVFTWLAYAGFYLCRKNFSVAMPLLSDDLGYTKLDFANVIFAYSLLYMLGQFLNGMLSDRFGARFMVGLGLLVSVGANVALGFTTTLLGFLLLSSLNGYAQSTGWSGTIKNMSAWYQQHERGVVMGWWCTCYVLGGVIATFVATYAAIDMPLLAEWGWRRAFWAPALLLLLVAVLYIVFTRNKPSDAGLGEITRDESSIPRLVPQSQPHFHAILHLMTLPALWVAGGTYFFLKLTRYAFLLWLPLYMTEALDYEKNVAGYTSGAYEFIGFTGTIVAGILSDKVFHSRRFPVATLMLVGLAVTCLIHPSLAALGLYGNILGIGLIGIMTFGPDSLMAAPAAQDIGTEEGAGTAAGVINGIGSLGQMCSPYVVAIVSDRYGWDSVFYLFVVFALFAAALTATKWNHGRREAAQP